MHVSYIQGNLPIAGGKVKRGKILRFPQLVQDILDARQRVSVMHGDAVEWTEIDAKTVGAIVFAYKVWFRDPITLR